MKVAVVDDNAAFRESLRELCDDYDCDTYVQEDPISDAGTFSRDMAERGIEAVLCDYKIVENGYSPCDGVQISRNLWDQKIVPILVTKFADSHIHHLRAFREFLPVIVSPTQLQDSGEQIFNREIQRIRSEILGKVSQDRKTYRSLLMVIGQDDNQGGYVDFLIPSWDAETIVRYPYHAIPQGILSLVMSGTEFFHAEVNVGAASVAEIFIKSGTWEAG